MLTEKQMRQVDRCHARERAGRLIDAAPFDLEWIPKGASPPTGCWSFDDDSGRNKIRLNAAVDEIVDLPPRQPAWFAVKVYRHEISHSMWTDPDFEKIRSLLNEEGKKRVPWLLFNLFEDARIEAHWRRSWRTPFGWRRWFDLPWDRSTLEQLRPEELFRGLIVCENSHREIRRLLDLAADFSPTERTRAEKIVGFYRAAAAKRSRYSADTVSLIPLCREWLEELSPPADQSDDDAESNTEPDSDSENETEPDSESESTEGWQPPSGHFHGDDWRTAVEEAIANGVDRLSGDEAEAEGPTAATPVFARDAEMDGFLGETYNPVWQLDYNRDSFRPNSSRRVAPLLARAWQGSTAFEKTARPGKRLLTRDYIRGSQRIYRSRSRVESARHKLVMIVDCSGSMDGEPALNGLTLLQVINDLHQRRKIEARVFLTFGEHVELPLPFPEDYLYSLVSLGPVEGIEDCMRANESALRWADSVCIYTDGEIGDAPVDLTAWRRKGIESIGLYVGESDQAPRLKQWFKYTIVRRSIDDLALALVRIMRRKAG